MPLTEVITCDECCNVAFTCPDYYPGTTFYGTVIDASGTWAPLRGMTFPIPVIGLNSWGGGIFYSGTLSICVLLSCSGSTITGQSFGHISCVGQLGQSTDSGSPIYMTIFRTMGFDTSTLTILVTE